MFAKFILRNNFCLKKINPTLKLCIVTSENCCIEDKKIMKEAFGVPVVNEYGASEVGVLAFEYPSGEWRLCEETVFIEIVDDNFKAVPPNKKGQIIVTSLFNRATPIIRYQIGDTGIINETANNVTHYRELKELSGRTNDFIKLPSGKISPGFSFYYISKNILESRSILKEFVVKQTELNKFVFEIVSDRDLNKDEIDRIKQAMDIYLEPGLILEIKRVDNIKRDPSGKTKQFQSLLSI